MRFIIKYTKEAPIKYISHLDLMRLIQRAIRRATIPVAYSKGFNPHPLISFASALAVGVTSQGEYLDISLDEYMDPETLRAKMNETLPYGIRFLKVEKLRGKQPSLMSLIERAEYLLGVWDDKGRPINVHPIINKFLAQGEIWITRKTRKGERKIDIRPLVHELKPQWDREEKFPFRANVSSGSKANLRPDLLIKALLDFTKINNMEDIYYSMHRLDLFLNRDGKWVNPMEIE